MKRLSFLVPLLAALLGLTGCTTTAPTPRPAAPAAVIEQPPARITGSEEESTMLDNFTAYVAAVDGVPVAAGRAGWSTPVTLKAGPRRLTLAFSRGVFAARTEIEFTAASDATYRVKFATDAQFLGKNSYCEFWIEDTATGAPACVKVRVPLTRLEAAN